jgi:protein-S-isoprenylcysteine O-methyltransferase Ste14
MIPQTVLWIAIALYPVSEIALTIFKRSKTPAGESQDQGSQRLIWIAVVLGVAAAVAAEWIPVTRLDWPDRIVRPVALVLILAGLAIRWWAIITLGRHFTTDVATQHQQPVIRTGPYRFVRHPSYTGELVVFVGIGVFMANWLSIIVLLAPITLAMFNRVRIEERTLLTALGAPYADYCSRVKRLIPGIL